MSLDAAWSRIQAIQSLVGRVQQLAPPVVAPDGSFAAQLDRAADPAAGAASVVGRTRAGAPGPAWVERLIDEASAKYKVDKNLIRAVMRAESDFNPNAGSSAGAVGLMQVMPQYVQEQSGFTAEPVRRDPRLNVFAGVAELRQNLDRYHGNIRLALAGYNAGPGAVAKYGGVPPYPETQAYIRKITAELGI